MFVFKSKILQEAHCNKTLLFQQKVIFIHFCCGQYVFKSKILQEAHCNKTLLFQQKVISIHFCCGQ